MRRPLASIFLVLFAAISFARAEVVAVGFGELPALPPAAGQASQPGVASPFVGVHGDALIVAGGANFPDRPPWEGGSKAWWDDVWVLADLRSGAPYWVIDPTFKLPRRLAYGIGVSTADGVVCVGGSDAERCYADVFLLSWDARERQMHRTALPPLPIPLANMAGALVGQVLYVAGGQHSMKGAALSSAFWALDLSKRNVPADFKWQVLPSWPGPPRVLAVAAAQRTARGEEFFLFGGRAPQPGAPTKILNDAYAFDPASRTWRTLPLVGGGLGLSVMAGVAAPVGDREILVFGGDRGELFLELEAHDLAIEKWQRELATAAPAGRAVLEGSIAAALAAKRQLYVAHPGFGREILAYDTQRYTWRVVAHSPVPPRVTTTAVACDGAILIPSGEIRPGVRTPAVVRATPRLR